MMVLQRKPELSVMFSLSGVCLQLY